MSKARTRRARARKARTRKNRGDVRRRRIAWKSWLGWAALAAVVIGVAALLIRGPGQSDEDPAIAELARQNAGGPIEVLRGSAHTVYHSNRPLPSAAVPRADGRPTLVWFSGTWCEFCERMDPFVHSTASRFSERIAFVEKSVDHDRSAASSYGVRGTPTFVLIDASGNEVARFHYQSNEAAFAQVIESALARRSPVPPAESSGPLTPLPRPGG